MRFKTRLVGFILATLLLLMANSILYEWAGESGSWAAIAVRNWNEYGFWALKGKLVVNPGGYEVLSHPEIYRGHRAASLYPIFFINRIFSWAGCGEWPFQIVFSLTLFLAIRRLLRKPPEAWLMAAAVLLSPVFPLYPAQGDPNAIALYMVLPFAAVVLPWLARPSLSPVAGVFLFIVVLAYTVLNWTTVFGHGMMIALIFMARSISRKRLILYLVLAGLSLAVVGTASVLDKMATTAVAGQGGGFKNFLAGYTWGSTGYGVNLTTSKAVIRIGFTNLAGLLPLVLVCGYLIIKHPRAKIFKTGTALLPLIAAILGVASMRNYFGHHPWMAAPMLVPGLVLSMRLILDEQVESKLLPPRAPARRLIWQFLFAAGSFVYAFALILMNEAYHTGTPEVVAMISAHTERSDTIVLVRNLDAKMAEETNSLSIYSDRRVVVVEDLSEASALGNHAFVVSAAELNGKLPRIATAASPAIFSSPVVQKLFAWYAKSIARRNSNDWHFKVDSQRLFQLYRVNPDGQKAMKPTAKHQNEAMLVAAFPKLFYAPAR